MLVYLILYLGKTVSLTHSSLFKISVNSLDIKYVLCSFPMSNNTICCENTVNEFGKTNTDPLVNVSVICKTIKNLNETPFKPFSIQRVRLKIAKMPLLHIVKYGKTN